MWFSNYISLKSVVFYLEKSVAREAGVQPKRNLAVAVPDRVPSKKLKKKVQESENDSSSGEFRVSIIIMKYPSVWSGLCFNFI